MHNGATGASVIHLLLRLIKPALLIIISVLRHPVSDCLRLINSSLYRWPVSRRWQLDGGYLRSLLEAKQTLISLLQALT